MKIRGVTRIEGPQGRGSGWMVRLTRNGKTTHKWFADGLHGGKRKALAAAREHQARLEAAAPPVSSPAERKTVRNTSGKVGVRLEQKTTVRGAREYEYEGYSAFWRTPEGSTQTITFSCSKYGRRKARQLASIARDHQRADRSWVERRHASAAGN
ncbi:MAG TPA: hypothetical protein VHE37_04305 [Nevskiaceae bacterium]|nr:hypothetical protein [Nevskiaceae bacterium]